MIHYYDKPHKITSNMSHYPAICGGFCDVRLKTQDRRSQPLANYTQPGIYNINVFGDPHLWLGIRKVVPSEPEIIDYTPNFLDEVKPEVLDMVRQKKLRMVVYSGAEGNSWSHAGELEGAVTSDDCFLALHIAMKKHDLPPLSVVIAAGDLNAAEDYEKWLKKTRTERLYEVTGHPGSFQYIARSDKLDNSNVPLARFAINNPKTRAYNSLNRIWKPHRAAHLYMLQKEDILKDGYVSCAYVDSLSIINEILPDISSDDLHRAFMNDYPRYLDGKFQDINKADNIYYGLYIQSQLSVVTESLYKEPNNVFFSEKTWKPLYVGHPFIFVSSNGHLKHLRKLGYKTEFDGIDSSYDDIEDPTERMEAIHRTLKIWCGFSNAQRHVCISNSYETLVHNMLHYRRTDHFLETINSIDETSERYFNDSI